jgi:serine protease Do
MRDTQKYHMSRWNRVLILSCLLITLILSGCFVAEKPAPAPTPTLPSFSEIVKEVLPSVVYIFVEIDTGQSGQFLAASGSGVILRSDGYILTNRHVIEEAKRVEVTLQDRRVFEASGFWMDDLLDLAVVKIEAPDLPTAQFGDPDTLSVGDWVIALGHPLGSSPAEGGATVTLGIVSNLGRSLIIEGTPYFDVIQTDAAINPGNSGGPLINLAGEVIGINSAGTIQAQNIGFAINIATARHVFENLVQYGRAFHPYLGATLEDITPSTACELCLTQRIGTVITDVEPGGPADLAGLQQNDVIVRFAEEEITSTANLIRVLWRHEAGDVVGVVFWRGETEMTVDITLAQRPKPGAV